MPLRKRAFKSPSEEYNRILDVVQKYAIHNPHSAWQCKKVMFPSYSTANGRLGVLYLISLRRPVRPLDQISDYYIRVHSPTIYFKSHSPFSNLPSSVRRSVDGSVMRIQIGPGEAVGCSSSTVRFAQSRVLLDIDKRPTCRFQQNEKSNRRSVHCLST